MSTMAHVVEEVVLLLHLVDTVEPDVELRDTLSVETGDGVMGRSSPKANLLDGLGRC